MESEIQVSYELLDEAERHIVDSVIRAFAERRQSTEMVKCLATELNRSNERLNQILNTVAAGFKA